MSDSKSQRPGPSESPSIFTESAEAGRVRCIAMLVPCAVPAEHVGHQQPDHRGDHRARQASGAVRTPLPEARS